MKIINYYFAVPLFFEKSLEGKELLGSYYNLSIPGPIILEDLSDKKFKKIIKIIIDEIEVRSKKKFKKDQNQFFRHN